jgi:hypothetical protein
VKQAETFLAALNKNSGRDGKFDHPLREPKDGGLQSVVEEALS